MPKGSRRRPIWSGTLAFGLVTLPVELYPTVRSSSSSLRMIAPDGTPLTRRYMNAQRGEILEQEDIVRGFEVDEGEFVLVEDEELDQLDPDKSRTIDLDVFVPRDQLDPLLVNSTYVLVPEQDAAVPAYRLLVASMADSGRAGIARFVMRERAYQLALISEGGSLRALTLRYPDEIRSPSEMGLPEPEAADVDDIEALVKEIRKLKADELDAEALVDHEAQRLQKLVKSKLRSKKNVIELPEEEAEPAEDDDAGEDIMVLLRRSLESEGKGSKRASA